MNNHKYTLELSVESHSIDANQGVSSADCINDLIPQIDSDLSRNKFYRLADGLMFRFVMLERAS
ncbi:hypothetical protein [Arenicella sp. 4NH20-0111]|uniref:hypothetical protein n=1 Tax=Arenicella sp. 4NH20-0111 TaxID=3127648 RepID=UPI003341304B